MKSGTASEHTTSAFLKSNISDIRSYVFSSDMFPYTILTPGIGAISKRSTATTVSGPSAGFPGLCYTYSDSTFSAIICDQPPGAAPTSMTLIPGWNRLNLVLISSSLKADLDLYFYRRAYFTNGSLTCRFIHCLEEPFSPDFEAELANGLIVAEKNIFIFKL